YGQKDPKQEYKKEGYNLFVNMVARVSSDVVTNLFRIQVKRPEEELALEQADLLRNAELLRSAVAQHQDEPVQAPVPAPEPAITSEMECPCGSGKPFNKCHGSEDEAVA
ncbi:MAG: SEC-C metal-binding domain-containing protein, partial [Minicystis sp.]